MEQLTLFEYTTQPCSDVYTETTARFKRSLPEAFGPYAVLTLGDPPPSRLECLFSQRLAKAVMLVTGTMAVGSVLFTIVIQGVKAHT